MGHKISPIRKARHKARVTIKALAEAVGVSTQTIFNYEIGRSNPDDKKFKKLQEKLGLGGTYEDWFDRKQITKYADDDECKYPECKRRPASNGYCMSHYINEWRKAKRKKEREKKLSLIEKAELIATKADRVEEKKAAKVKTTKTRKVTKRKVTKKKSKTTKSKKSKTTKSRKR